MGEGLGEINTQQKPVDRSTRLNDPSGMQKAAKWEKSAAIPAKERKDFRIQDQADVRKNSIERRSLAIKNIVAFRSAKKAHWM